MTESEIKREKRDRRQRINFKSLIPVTKTTPFFCDIVQPSIPQILKTTEVSTPKKEDSSPEDIQIQEEDRELEATSAPLEESSSAIDIQRKRSFVISIEKTVIVKTGTESRTFEIISKLGEGGFGVVYQCKCEKTGQMYAMKKILNRGRGIPCLMEASISASYSHPYINKTVIISANSEGIYMIQDMAKYDIHNWRKKTKPTEMDIKNIFYKVALGLEFLHKQGIVHGDVKPSNILYYSDDDIRLSDFNLTTYSKWKSLIHLCTSTYRSYELWARKKWNEKIDIWSLGCTIFEIIYNKGLIPWQGDDKFSRWRYMNCIMDWAKFNAPPREFKKKAYTVEYHKPRIHPTLIHGDINTPLIKLMLKCLQMYPEDRPNIQTILADPYFDDVRSSHKLTISYSTLGIGTDKNFYNQIKKDLEAYVGDHEEDLLVAAANICSEFVKRSCYNNHMIKKVCVWIAKKLLRNDTPGQEIPNADKSLKNEDILYTEILICDTLGFKLH